MLIKYQSEIKKEQQIQTQIQQLEIEVSLPLEKKMYKTVANAELSQTENEKSSSGDYSAKVSKFIIVGLRAYFMLQSNIFLKIILQFQYSRNFVCLVSCK
ncbi:hypothetical protein ABPG72_014287 [Tetrahymena utriculariae]